MAETIYRLAQESDLERTYEVFVRATSDLLVRRNLPPIPYSGAAPPRPLAFRRHALIHDRQRFWVAQDGGAVVGFGVATLRESLWYLAALHVMPGYQNRGIGQQLLRLCRSGADAPEPGLAPPKTRIVISDSLNPDSNALYAKYGLYQWVPLLNLQGPVPASLAVSLAVTRIDSGDARLAEFDALDRHVLEVARPQDHQLWLAQPDLSAYLFYQEGRVVGYSYISTDGGIGPLAAYHQDSVPAIMAASLAQLHAQGLPAAALKVPGVCHAGLQFLLAAKFRIKGILLIDASRPFGNLHSYCVSAGDAIF